MLEHFAASDTSPSGLEVKLQLGAGSGVLVVVFSQVRIPSGKFGLERLFAKTQHSLVFLNDIGSQWYLNAEHEIDAAIDDAIAREEPKRIIYYGASMGAYGALITGLRRGDGEIFAFSPELELGAAGTQSVAYVKQPYPDTSVLHALLSQAQEYPVHLFFGLFDWVDTSGYLNIQRLPWDKNRHCYGLAGPHALHDQLYTLNIIRQLIKTFNRNVPELLLARQLMIAPSMDECEALVSLGRRLAQNEAPVVQETMASILGNPGYGKLEAERLAIHEKPYEGAQLLFKWHRAIQNDAVMMTTPKRWRKEFLIRAAELYEHSSDIKRAKDALLECTGLFPIDARMTDLAIRLKVVLPKIY
ncbi:hypothetical protein PsAD2_01776 [Pseudovibrio axinellae]|uniref:Alpha/beta hydrolase family protein n=1 Tax=Pseudovibrio axinellae TaxID=989403 RepID=A0A165Z4D6_9HYPH|nr:hypothetical protein [Pseudovibrio axinellae]KZL19498.1 hypothetical protein PsAD2_01776 [Pseudovibrio axinellae]SEQ29329.1 hypothetical protein SAMN05421798_102337 [Pseudovibrio axinellae]